MQRVHRSDDVVHVAFDASKNTLVAGILHLGEETPAIERVFKDEVSIRRFVKRFSEPGRLRTCCEAGPSANEFQRFLASLKVHCEVIAPALIPLAPGNRVKTDKRDVRRLVRQFPAGELVAIRVPTRSEEAVRDLCRARGDAVEDLTRAKNRLGHFLLRHGRVYRDATPWMFKHRNWLGQQSFDKIALTTTFGRCRSTVECREAELMAIEADLTCYFEREPFAEPVYHLAAYRGVDFLGALVLQAEVCDWRRSFGRAAAGAFCGLVPSEYSSGERTQRASLTHAGNAHLRYQLVESALGLSRPEPRRGAPTPPRGRLLGDPPTPGRLRSTSVVGSVSSTRGSPCGVSSSRRSPGGSSASPR